MTSIQIDIKDGLSSSTAIKGPCRVATTANITLVGEQTIDGVAVVTDDRVLVKNQTTASENGIYIADTGNWRRSKDFNKTKDVKTGTMVNVTAGTVGAGQWQISTTGDISIGTTSIAFVRTIEAFVGLPFPAVANTFLQRDAGNTAYDAKTGTEVRDYIQANKPYSVLWAGADPTNTSDSVAAFVTAEANGSIYIPDGSYKIATNWSPVVAVKISSGAKLYIADGKTIDFAAATVEIHAPKKQRFYFPGTGTGVVSNLEVSHAGWFAGDNLNTTTNSLTALQKWADSIATGGIGKWTRGYYTSNGSDYINFTKTQHVEGYGRETSLLTFSGTVTKGFRFTTGNGESPSVRNMGFNRANSLIAPTDGYAIWFEVGRKWQANGIYTSGMYRAIVTAVSDGNASQVQLLDSLHAGIYVDAVNETQVNQGIIAANSMWLITTGDSGSFAASETFTWAGGSGTIFGGTGGQHKIIADLAQPAPATVITGSTSGVTATVSSVTKGHQIGGIRLWNHCHASVFNSIEISGGAYSLTTDATDTTNTNRSLANRFTNCLFDSNQSASVLLAKSVFTTFTACWFSTFGATDAVNLTDTWGTVFTACNWENVGRRCILANATALNTQVLDGSMSTFNTSNTANTAAILFIAAASGVVRGTRIGDEMTYGTGHAARGIEIGVGCAVTVDDPDTTLCTTGIVDNSGGTAIIRYLNGKLKGTATNDNAAAGVVGEYMSSVIASGSAVSLTTATPANLTSLTLTPGDWDVDAMWCFTGGATTTVAYLLSSISQTSATQDLTNGRADCDYYANATVFNLVAGNIINKAVHSRRISVAANTTVYAVAQASFATSTCTVFGTLTARRVR